MAFTDRERRAWLEEKRKREQAPEVPVAPYAYAVCLHCQLPFGINGGVVTDDAALCDVCNGD